MDTAHRTQNGVAGKEGTAEAVHVPRVETPDSGMEVAGDGGMRG